MAYDLEFNPEMYGAGKYLNSLASRELAGVQPVPVEQPGFFGKIGNYLTGLPGVGAANNFMKGISPTMKRLAPALALGGKAALALGGTRGTPANAIAELAGNMAAQRGVNAVTGGQPSQAQQNAPTVIPQQTPAAQADVNQNGVPDNLEVKHNLTLSGPAGAVKSSLPGLLSSFQGTSGPSVGTPEVASQVPTYDREQALQEIAGLVGPKEAIDLATHSMNAIAPQMAAQAAYKEAALKEAMLPYTVEHTGAQTADLRSQVEHRTWERSPDYVQQKGRVKQAETEGEANAKAIELNNFVASPVGKVVIPAEIAKANGLPYGTTFGAAAAMASDKGFADKLLAHYAANANAKIEAGGRVTAAELGTMKMLQDGAIRDATMASLNAARLGDPKYTILFQGDPKRVAENNTLIKFWNDSALEAQRRAEAYRTAIEGGAKNLAPSNRRRQPEAKKATVPEGATGVYTGTRNGVSGTFYKDKGKSYFLPD